MTNVADAPDHVKTVWYYNRPRAHYPLITGAGQFLGAVPPLQTLWTLVRSSENLV